MCVCGSMTCGDTAMVSASESSTLELEPPWPQGGGSVANNYALRRALVDPKKRVGVG